MKASFSSSPGTLLRSLARSAPSAHVWETILHTLLPSAVRMVGAGFQFLSTVIVARTLGDGPSANFFFWSSVLMTSGPIATFGLEQIALRNVPRLQRDHPEKVGRFVAHLRAISVLLSFLIGLGWAVYAVISQAPPGGVRLWHFLPPLLLGAIAVALINGEAFKGLSRPVMGSVYGHLLPVTLFFILVVLFAKHLGSPGILTLYTGSYLIGALAARHASGGEFRKCFLAWPDRATLRSLLAEGLPICLVSFFGALGFIIPLAFFELTRPAAEVSHLTAAFRISILFAVLSSAIHSVFAPALSRSAELPDPLRPLFRVYGKAILIALVALALPLGLGIAFPERVMSIFGEEFLDGVAPLRLLLLLQLVSLILGPVPHLLLMTGHTVFLARTGIVKFLATVILSFFFIPRYGGSGMVYAMGLAFVGEDIAGLLHAFRKLRTAKIKPKRDASGS
ncbi:MAG: lipopolysaccharide biosynthesis protein [Verrucomicrobiaceae bacterium]|nr:lipopolysaccharide biosynthesis protein [Verrucomicrobiaceae bacterium]